MRLIDADALIKKAYSEIEGMDKPYKDFGTILEWLVDKMPTIEPKRKKGRWIDIDAETYTWMIKCDKCGHLRSMMSTNGIYPKFCENCGAKMEVAEE